MVSTLKSLNSLKLEDIHSNENSETKAKLVMPDYKYVSNLSGIGSTTLTNTNKDDEIKATKQSHSLQQSTQKVKNYSMAQNPAYHDSNLAGLEISPTDEKKKKRKLWRIGKSNKLKNKMADPEWLKSIPKDFYSLGNSITKTESISLNSQMTSSVDVKSKTYNKRKKPSKPKSKVSQIPNFSDRTLSSKLYSVKRKEIYLFNSSRSKKKYPDSSAKSSKKYKNSKSCLKKCKTITKTQSYLKHPKIRAKVDLSENSRSLIKVHERAKVLGKTPSRQRIDNNNIKTWVRNPHNMYINQELDIDDDGVPNIDHHTTETDSNDTLSIIYRHFNVNKESIASSMDASKTSETGVVHKRNSHANRRIEEMFNQTQGKPLNITC